MDNLEVRRRAFRLLLRDGEPVGVERIVAGSGASPDEVETAATTLAARGAITRDPSGAIVGSAGLSVVPTRHEISVGGVRRWTWCALDAVGIIAALRQPGVVRSTSPQTGDGIEVIVNDDTAPQGSAVIFLADAGGDSIVDDWCPNVNLFSTEDEARTWAAAHGIDGRVVSVPEAAELGSTMWADLVAEVL